MIEQSENEFVFQRGKKSSTLWRFDIRTYFTTLKVRLSKQKTDETYISLDWDVYTFMALTTGGDVSTLEAEGHELEAIIKTMA